MSFGNTHTPLRSEITGKARYQCPMHKVRGVDAYYLTPELEERFRKLFPVTLNRDMMRLFGISFVTMQRFKRKLGLKKNKRTIIRKQAEVTKKICEANGFYDRMRGVARTEQEKEAMREGYRRKLATGWRSLKSLRHKNNKKYHRVVKQWGERRKELIRKERIREYNGLERQTKLYIPYDAYGTKRLSFRNCCRTAGYIPGNARDPEERWVIYYTPETKRGEIREKNGRALGFRFELKNGDK